MFGLQVVCHVQVMQDSTGCYNTVFQIFHTETFQIFGLEMFQQPFVGCFGRKTPVFECESEIFCSKVSFKLTAF